MTDIETRTLEAPGATITYDVRGNLADATPEAPVLLIAGSPMGADGFVTLASHFTDRPVVTYDPRGVSRSTRTDPSAPVTPDHHADDLHLVIAALGAGPVDVLASSGGAVNALALVTNHPEQVRTLVAHEPPSGPALPDRDAALAAVQAVSRSYQDKGFGAGMAHFIALTSWEGPFPTDFADQPAPDPGAFGFPTEDDGSRDDALLGQNLISCTHYEHDYDALSRVSTRVVLAAGEESGEQMAARAARGVAKSIGTEAVAFPSGHGGFMGDEYGMPGDPDGFAAALRKVLEGTDIR
ncbi:alpha/beta fold hydrolase [Oerskovia jenensis]|uniref:Pimeloyl-ACP methyl ester carboxylesterase n=1 Tax=Oerskovia jenensis TaxID=162169 RepID=A0ABS2LDW5_9CELL|nr:alpha/beta hydrolase [Oerskovia jenensis]MBM7478616.1 pimeloyl-ACP methyl ester carboxylesterase [Oerskovia jenensis]